MKESSKTKTGIAKKNKKQKQDKTKQDYSKVSTTISNAKV